MGQNRSEALRFEGLQYTDVDIADFETRLARIYKRGVHMVHVFDFGGLPDLMAEGLSDRMLMEHIDGQECEADPRHRGSECYWIGISSAGDFLGTAPSYTLIRDPMLRLCHRLIACSIAGRIQAPEKVLEFVCLGEEAGAMISGDATAGAHKAVKDALAVDEGAQAIPKPIQAPQPPPPPPLPPAAGKTMPQRSGRLKEDVHSLCQDIVSLRGLVERSMTNQGRLPNWMISCMMQLIEASEQTY
ncbi:hypothetical protein Tco_0970618 [Tanacetum coccineum]